MTKKAHLASVVVFFGLFLGTALLPETALSNSTQTQPASKSKRRKKGGRPAKKTNESAKQAQQPEPAKQDSKADSGFKKFQCVTWEVTVRTNPLFPDADTVDWDVTGNVLDSGDGQCEVKIKSQKKTTFFLTSRPPYRDGETVIIECNKLRKCE